MEPKYVVLDTKHIEILPRYDRDMVSHVQLAIDYWAGIRGLQPIQKTFLVVSADEPEFEAFSKIMAERKMREAAQLDQAGIDAERESLAMSYSDRLQAYADIVKAIQDSGATIQPHECVRIKHAGICLDHSAPGETLLALADSQKIIEFANIKGGKAEFAAGGTWIDATAKAKRKPRP